MKTEYLVTSDLHGVDGVWTRHTGPMGLANAVEELGRVTPLWPHLTFGIMKVVSTKLRPVNVLEWREE